MFLNTIRLLTDFEDIDELLTPCLHILMLSKMGLVLVNEHDALFFSFFIFSHYLKVFENCIKHDKF